MNIYQQLNQEYRAFKTKERLIKESEAKKAKELKESAQTTDKSVANRLQEIDARLTSIDDSLKTASDDEKEALLKERNELVTELDEIDASLPKTECDAPIQESTVSVNTDDAGNVSVDVQTDTDSVDVGVQAEPVTPEEVPTEEPVEEIPTEEPPVEDIPTEEPLDDSEEPKKHLCKECGKECEGEICEECSKAVKEAGVSLSVDVPDEVVTTAATSLLASEEPGEEITEAEVTSYKVTRVSPKSGAFMIEAQTSEGLKFITGKNFDAKELTLDEAEITDNKLNATERFKSLLSK